METRLRMPLPLPLLLQGASNSKFRHDGYGIWKALATKLFMLARVYRIHIRQPNSRLNLQIQHVVVHD
jgi:hypothetical protein